MADSDQPEPEAKPKSKPKSKPEASQVVKGKRATHSDLIAQARARRAGKA